MQGDYEYTELEFIQGDYEYIELESISEYKIVALKW
jgi:hypothetical protein